MKWHAVKSSNIDRISERDPETGDVHIQFRGGATYIHRNVPADVYRGLMEAGSKGSYYAAHLKNRFGVTRVNG